MSHAAARNHQPSIVSVMGAGAAIGQRSPRVMKRLAQSADRVRNIWLVRAFSEPSAWQRNRRAHSMNTRMLMVSVEACAVHGEPEPEWVIANTKDPAMTSAK